MIVHDISHNISTDISYLIGCPVVPEPPEPSFDPSKLEYQAIWTVNGKTNNDTDKNVPNLVDATNPLIVSNFAYKLNSGYQLFNQDFMAIFSNNITIMRPDVRTYNMFKGTAISKLIATYWMSNNLYLNKSFKVRLTSNLPELTGYFSWKNKESVEIKRIDVVQNTIVTIPTFTDEEFASFSSNTPEFMPYLAGSPDDWYQLEQIPEGEGLFMDGIDDSIKSFRPLGLLDKYTVVGDFYIESKTNCGFCKISNWYFYKNMLFIKSTGIGNPINNAFAFSTSGAVLSKNGEYIANNIGVANIVNYVSTIGGYFIATFKSLAIIPQELNIDQIKMVANYIKTLKANNIG